MKLSIVIPAYNCEKTISKCLDSLITFKEEDYEIIVINDGSTDNTQKILKSFEQKYKLIQSYNINNCGVSNARNLGIELSKGDYITFVDSDDYVSHDYVRTILNKTESNKDIYFFKAQVIGLNASVEKNNSIFISNCSDLMTVKDSIINGKSNVPWDKVFKRSLIVDHQVKFRTDMSLGEDWFFTMDYFTFCKSFEIIYNTLYFYCVQENSLSTKKMTVNMLNNQFMLMEKILDFSNYNYNSKRMVLQLMLNSCSKALRAGIDKSYLFKKIEENKWYDDIIKCKYNDKKSNLRLIVLKLRMTMFIKLIFGNK